MRSAVELIQAELRFVEYLAAGRVRVSRPIPSVHGNLLEVISAIGMKNLQTRFSIRVPANILDFDIRLSFLFPFGFASAVSFFFSC